MYNIIQVDFDSGWNGILIIFIEYKVRDLKARWPYYQILLEYKSEITKKNLNLLLKI